MNFRAITTSCFDCCVIFCLSEQDKSVAFKIFELGLKKYGDIPEYILAYIDYLSHLNGESDLKWAAEYMGTLRSLSLMACMAGYRGLWHGASSVPYGVGKREKALIYRALTGKDTETLIAVQKETICYSFHNKSAVWSG